MWTRYGMKYCTRYRTKIFRTRISLALGVGLAPQVVLPRSRNPRYMCRWRRAVTVVTSRERPHSFANPVARHRPPYCLRCSRTSFLASSVSVISCTVHSRGRKKYTTIATNISRNDSMKKTKDVSDEDEYSADDPEEVGGASEEEWTPEAGAEVSLRHTLHSRATPLSQNSILRSSELRSCDRGFVCSSSTHFRRDYAAFVTAFTLIKVPVDEGAFITETRSTFRHTSTPQFGRPANENSSRSRIRHITAPPMWTRPVLIGAGQINTSVRMLARTAKRSVDGSGGILHLCRRRCDEYTRREDPSIGPYSTHIHAECDLTFAMDGFSYDKRAALLERIFRGAVARMRSGSRSVRTAAIVVPAGYRPHGGADRRAFQISGAGACPSVSQVAFSGLLIKIDRCNARPE